MPDPLENCIKAGLRGDESRTMIPGAASFIVVWIRLDVPSRVSSAISRGVPGALAGHTKSTKSEEL
jgi:hypothetical protein